MANEYLIVSEWRPEALSVVANGSKYMPCMSDATEGEKIKWLIVADGTDTYRIHNESLGTGKSLQASLSGQQFQLTMADTNRANSDQLWKLNKVVEGDSVNGVRFYTATDFAGEKWSLTMVDASNWVPPYAPTVERDNVEFLSQMWSCLKR